MAMQTKRTLALTVTDDSTGKRVVTKIKLGSRKDGATDQDAGARWSAMKTAVQTVLNAFSSTLPEPKPKLNISTVSETSGN